MLESVVVLASGVKCKPDQREEPRIGIRPGEMLAVKVKAKHVD